MRKRGHKALLLCATLALALAACGDDDGGSESNTKKAPPGNTEKQPPGNTEKKPPADAPPSGPSCPKPSGTAREQALVGMWSDTGSSLKVTYEFNADGTFQMLYKGSGLLISGGGGSTGCYKVIGDQMQWTKQLAWYCSGEACFSGAAFKETPREDQTVPFDFIWREPETYNPHSAGPGEYYWPETRLKLAPKLSNDYTYFDSEYTRCGNPPPPSDNIWDSLAALAC